jgi:hypothetical protein
MVCMPVTEAFPNYKIYATNNVKNNKGGEPASLRTRFRLGPGDSPEAYELDFAYKELATVQGESGVLSCGRERDLFRNSLCQGPISQSMDFGGTRSASDSAVWQEPQIKHAFEYVLFATDS